MHKEKYVSALAYLDLDIGEVIMNDVKFRHKDVTLGQLGINRFSEIYVKILEEPMPIAMGGVSLEIKTMNYLKLKNYTFTYDDEKPLQSIVDHFKD